MGGSASKGKRASHRRGERGRAPAFGGSGSAPECYMCMMPDTESGSSADRAIPLGCSCRLVAHVSCAVKFFGMGPDNIERWMRCATCTQQFGGAFRMGVARARFELVKGLPINSDARLMGTRVIAHCFVDAGQHGRALAILTALELELAKKHPHARGLPEILIDKATALSGLGRSQEHTDTLYRVLSSRGDRADTDPVIMEANSQLALALVYAKDGNMVLAEERALNAVAASSLGPDQRKQLIYKNTLVSVLAKLGRYDEALALLAEMLPVARRVLAPDHAITLTVLHNTAAYTLRAGKVELYRESADIARSVYEKRLASIGPEHPNTQASRRVLRSGLETLGLACANPNCVSAVSKLPCPRCKRVRYCADACLVADRGRHGTDCERKSAHTKRR